MGQECVGPEWLAGKAGQRFQTHHHGGVNVVDWLEDDLEIALGDHASDGRVAIGSTVRRRRRRFDQQADELRDALDDAQVELDQMRAGLSAHRAHHAQG